MKGELNLSTLLREMQPILQPEKYVFCTFPLGEKGKSGLIKEAEGLSLTLQKNIADQEKLTYY